MPDCRVPLFDIKDAGSAGAAGLRGALTRSPRPMPYTTSVIPHQPELREERECLNVGGLYNCEVSAI